MKIQHVAKLFSNDKGYRLFAVVAEREWTDKESGEVKNNVAVHFLSFSHPSKKIDEAAVLRLFEFASKFRGMWQDIQKKGDRSMMGAKECYFDEAAVSEILAAK